MISSRTALFFSLFSIALVALVLILDLQSKRDATSVLACNEHLNPDGKIIHIDENKALQDYSAKAGLFVFVDSSFGSGPGRMMTQVLESLAMQCYPNISVVALNIESNEKFQRKYDIKGVPVLMYFVANKEVARITGAQDYVKVGRWLNEEAHIQLQLRQPTEMDYVPLKYRHLEFDGIMDARGVNQPKGLIEANKKLKSLGKGKAVLLIGTDPGLVKDMKAYAVQTGNNVAIIDEDKLFVYLVEKK